MKFQMKKKEIKRKKQIKKYIYIFQAILYFKNNN